VIEPSRPFDISESDIRESDIPERKRRTILPILEVPSRYRVPTRGEARFEVSGRTLRDCIAEAEKRFPGFQELIINSEGHPKRFVRFFLNGDALERDALDSALEAEDTITIMASAAGG
jgi:molybdopterin converting factor small subunit